MVVVLPVPLTPTTRITAGSWPTSRTGGSPKSSATSSASASLSSASSPRASSRRTSSAVARTPTSPAMSASSSRSQCASSPGSNTAAASSPVSARRDFESESRSREKKRPPCSSGSGAAPSSPSSCAQLRGELPLLSADQRHLRPVCQHRVDLELRPADHEVDVHLRVVAPLPRLTLEGVRQPRSVRDVAGRVLVEERVEEKSPGLTDAGLPRDERELAEPVGVLDHVELTADEVRALLGSDTDDPPILERELETADDLAVECEWQRRTDRA